MKTEAIRAKFEGWHWMKFHQIFSREEVFKRETQFPRIRDYEREDIDGEWKGYEAGYEQAVKDMEAENDIYHFIEFIDGIQGRDMGGADVLSWSDLSSATDLKNFLEVYKAHKARS